MTRSRSVRGATIVRAPMQVVSGPSGGSASTSKRQRRTGSQRRCSDSSTGSTATPRTDPVLKAALCAPVVRDDPSVRRRQWPHRARDRRHGARAIGRKPAALLQHVGADPAGAQRLLRHSGADAAGDHGRHAVDGRGSSPASRALSTGRRHAGGVLAKARFWERLRDVPLNDRQRLVFEPAARRLRGQADDVEMGEAGEMLAGHGAPRHPAARRARRAGAQRGRRAQHELLARRQ